MRRPYHLSGASALLLLAVVLTLSGCSLVWAVPAPGMAIVLAGLLIGLAVQGLRAAPPVDRPGAAPAVTLSGTAEPVPGLLIVPPADADPDSAPGDRVEGPGSVRGDGLMDAHAAQALAQAADATPAAPRLVFDGSAARDSGDEAGVILAGDGFSTTDEGGHDGYLLVADNGMNPFEGDEEAIKRGGVTFNTRCGTYCHGGQAIGGGCPSLVDESWIHGDGDLDIYRVIVGGGGEGTRMGAFGAELSADEIWEIIAYLRHRGKEFLLEKAGPDSFRAKVLEQCPGEAVLTIQSIRNRTYEGVIVIEDPKSLTLEDRSKERPLRRRVLKNRIDSVDISCLDES